MTRNAKHCIDALPLAAFLFCVLFSPNIRSVEYSIKSDVSTRIEYNDNIFMTTLPHDSVSKLSIAPSLSMVATEQNWQSFINAKLKSNNYSEDNLDSDDVYFDLSSNYTQERNIYALSGKFNKDSNLDFQSTDFGITGERVNREMWDVAPQYQRMLTERLIFSASYSHTEVEYIDSTGTGYVPSATDTLRGSLTYGLTEQNRLSYVMQASDYASQDNAIEYQLFVIRIGIDTNFSETFTTNLAIGSSKRNSTNTTFQTVDFIGQLIIVPQVSDFSDKGFVLDAGLNMKFEAGSLGVSVSRDDVTNSYGGLNEVSAVELKYKESLTPLWRYDIRTRYEIIDAVSSVNRSTDRDTMFFEPRVFYAIDRHWTASAGYRHIKRKFDSDIDGSERPSSNMVFVGMTYNFPDISTH